MRSAEMRSAERCGMRSDAKMERETEMRRDVEMRRWRERETEMRRDAEGWGSGMRQVSSLPLRGGLG